MEKDKFIIIITILIGSIVTLQAIHFAKESPIRELAKLERKLDNLREKGISIEYVDIDDEIGYLVVAFNDMEPEYVEPVREIVGYDRPVLFRELELKRVLVGEPPASLLKICRAINLLIEVGYRVDSRVDVERGLLRLIFRDLIDEEIQKIRGLVGHDVPIEFEKREWRDQLYIGKPSLMLEALEDASRKLGQAKTQSKLIQNTVSGSGVDRKAGLLKIYLWEQENYVEIIEVIRNVLEYDTPLAFVFFDYERPEERNFTTAEAVSEHYVNLLNLPDIGYEIVWQTEDEAEASIYFIIEDEQVPFQKLELYKTEGLWEWRCRRIREVPSPSRKLEIVGYLTSVFHHGVSSIIPLVKNLGDETAYIWSVEVEVKNSTHTLNQSYLTVGFGLLDGLIRPGEVKEVYPIMPGEYWRLEESEELVVFQLDSARGKTYTITITLKDGEDKTLAENTFIHTFAHRTG
jgi:hypothetical protein